MNELYKILLLLFIFIVPGFIYGWLHNDKKEDLLREIRDELKKKNKNKKDEPLEGEVIE